MNPSQNSTTEVVLREVDVVLVGETGTPTANEGVANDETRKQREFTNDAKRQNPRPRPAPCASCFRFLRKGEKSSEVENSTEKKPRKRLRRQGSTGSDEAAEESGSVVSENEERSDDKAALQETVAVGEDNPQDEKTAQSATEGPVVQAAPGPPTADSGTQPTPQPASQPATQLPKRQPAYEVLYQPKARPPKVMKTATERKVELEKIEQERKRKIEEQKANKTKAEQAKNTIAGQISVKKDSLSKKDSLNNNVKTNNANPSLASAHSILLFLCKVEKKLLRMLSLYRQHRIPAAWDVLRSIEEDCGKTLLLMVSSSVGDSEGGGLKDDRLKVGDKSSKSQTPARPKIPFDSLSNFSGAETVTTSSVTSSGLDSPSRNQIPHMEYKRGSGASSGSGIAEYLVPLLRGSDALETNGELSAVESFKRKLEERQKRIEEDHISQKKFQKTQFTEKEYLALQTSLGKSTRKAVTVEDEFRIENEFVSEEVLIVLRLLERKEALLGEVLPGMVVKARNSRLDSPDFAAVQSQFRSLEGVLLARGNHEDLNTSSSNTETNPETIASHHPPHPHQNLLLTPSDITFIIEVVTDIGDRMLRLKLLQEDLLPTLETDSTPSWDLLDAEGRSAIQEARKAAEEKKGAEKKKKEKKKLERKSDNEPDWPDLNRELNSLFTIPQGTLKNFYQDGFFLPCNVTKRNCGYNYWMHQPLEFVVKNKDELLNKAAEPTVPTSAAKISTAIAALERVTTQKKKNQKEKIQDLQEPSTSPSSSASSPASSQISSHLQSLLPQLLQFASKEIQDGFSYSTGLRKSFCASCEIDLDTPWLPMLSWWHEVDLFPVWIPKLPSFLGEGWNLHC